MLCVGARAHRRAAAGCWAVWDRDARRAARAHELRRPGARSGCADGARARARRRPSRSTSRSSEAPGRRDRLRRTARGYVWTRKQAAVARARARSRVGRRRAAPSTRSASSTTPPATTPATPRGAGRRASARRRRARRSRWNLVDGVNDAAGGAASARVWVDGAPREVGPGRASPTTSARCAFAEGGALRFAAEADARAPRRAAGLRARDYRQPFGTFTGTLPGGIELARGLRGAWRGTARAGDQEHVGLTASRRRRTPGTAAPAPTSAGGSRARGRVTTIATHVADDAEADARRDRERQRHAGDDEERGQRVSRARTSRCSATSRIIR